MNLECMNPVTIESIPPQTDGQPQTGVLSLQVKVVYLNVTEHEPEWRIKLWGRDNDQPMTLQHAEKKQNCFVRQLTIRCNHQKLSKYFADMGVLQISLVKVSLKSTPTANKNPPAIKTEHKVIGEVYVNLKRFFINHLISTFDEVFAVVDLKKKVIGEIQLAFDMHFDEIILDKTVREPSLQPTLKEIEPMKQNLSGNTHQDIANPPSTNQVLPRPVFKPDVHQQPSPIHQPRSISNSDSFSRLEFPQLQQPEIIFKTKKQLAEKYVEEYMKAKPSHTDLSLIINKYGCNHPAVEIMKLKLDEAQLIEHMAQSTHRNDIQIGDKIIVVLKTLVQLAQKQSMKDLTIVYTSKKTQHRTETKITLADPEGKTIAINYLYMLASPAKDDRISFETKQHAADATLGEFFSDGTITLKGKANNRKGLQLNYGIMQSSAIKESQPSIQQPNALPDVPVKQHDIDQQISRQKKTVYIRVDNCLQPKRIRMSCPELGTVTARKVIYESNNPKSIKISISSEQVVHVIGSQLYQEQKYQFGTEKVTVVTAFGALQEVLMILRHMEASKEQQVPQIAKVDVQNNAEEYSKILVELYQVLETCENEQCREVIEQLLQPERLNQNLLKKLAAKCKTDPEKFSLVLSKLFQNNFQQFFKGFQFYHMWNHRYVMAQKKLLRSINAQDRPRGKALLKAIRKIRNSPKLMFGLVNESELSDEIIRQFELIQGQEHSVNAEQTYLTVEELVFMVGQLFQRYRGSNIKLLELESLVQDSQVCNINHHIFKRIASAEEVPLLAVYFAQEDGQTPDPLPTLLAQCEDLSENDSELVSSDQQLRKDTQARERPHQTEISKQEPLNAERPNQKAKFLTEEESRHSIKDIPQDKPLTGPKLNLTLRKIQLDHCQPVKRLYMNDELLPTSQLPLVMALRANQPHKVLVLTESRQYEGVFIADAYLSRIILYSMGKEAGRIHLSVVNESSEADFEIQINDKVTATIPKPNTVVLAQHAIVEAQLIRKNTVSSPFIRLRLCSISPSSANNHLVVTNIHTGQQIDLDSELTLAAEPNYELQLASTSKQCYYDTMPLVKVAGINMYAACEKVSQRADYLITVEIEECWAEADEHHDRKTSQENCKILTVYSLLCLHPLLAGPYRLMVEHQHTAYMDFQVSLGSSGMSRAIVIMKSVPICIGSRPCRLKLISESTRSQLSQFVFTISSAGSNACILRESRTLVSCNDESSEVGNSFRLMVDVHEIQYPGAGIGKMDRTVGLFHIDKLNSIRGFLADANRSARQRQLRIEELISFLKVSFELTLSEINYLFKLICSVEVQPDEPQLIVDSYQMQPIVEFFNSPSYPQSSRLPTSQQATVSTIAREFDIFDCNNNGIINKNRAEVVRHLLIHSYSSLQKLPCFKFGETLRKTHENCRIVDLNVQPAIQDQLDYLHFLYTLMTDVDDGYFNPTCNNLADPLKHATVSQGGLKVIELVSFENLSIDSVPSTLEFRVQGNPITESIPRCYSYHYRQPFPQLLVDQPRDTELQLEIYCKKIGVSGYWQYDLVDKVRLSEQIHVLGGTINLRIAAADQQSSETHIKKKQRPGVKPDTKPAIRSKKTHSADTSKESSIWNKAMAETRKKWQEQADEPSQIIGRDKKMRDILNLTGQQLDDKFNLFEQSDSDDS